MTHTNKREQQTQQRWIQQVAGNPRWEIFPNKTPQERESRLQIQREQQHSEGKHCQLETEAIQRPRICTLQSEGTPTTDALAKCGQ